MSILDEFGEHECEVCGTDCVAVEEMLESKDKRIADLTTEIERLNDNSSIGESLLKAIKEFQPNYSWNNCPTEIVLHLTNEIECLTKENARLRAPVSDEELAPYIECIQPIGEDCSGWYVAADQVTSIIAARAKEMQ